MLQKIHSNSIRTFLLIWSGQTVSIIGSSMTGFAFTIWVWELTSQATALALFGLFAQIPQLLTTPFMGVIVDRGNRKLLMAVGDTVAGILTITILLLYLRSNLQVWHLYVAVAVNGIFQQLQELAYKASISMIVPESQYSRASSMGSLASYSSKIVAPALAGTLYYVMGLRGILIVDIATFAIAICTVAIANIPQPILTETPRFSLKNIQEEISFGFRYIATHPSLLALLALTSMFWLVHDLSGTLRSPMILARTGNDARILGLAVSAAGLGGIVGALAVSAWGGPKRRIHGFLLGMAGAGLSKTVFGLGVTPLVWTLTQFCSSLNFPLLGSSADVIWLVKVKPEVQGRVFATRSVSLLVASTVGYSIAGPLVDRVFEPAMMPKGSLAPVFGGLFGTGTGSGIALLYASCGLCMLILGLGGYAFRVLRDVEDITSDFSGDYLS
ncbi:MFS transporter [Kamptonema sp. UHCC 0994]|uniref:MFS transporter n=1 Tax=Kamptonema sp. UHCC 0994 TaxID=3031329 RepID=UPI0023B99FB5|nr:MFS transporter [Kamptonema sp. UHCC 0994]MDF0552720.1 MFS transporter [Kamptonema sp. UHCC 0994]